MKIILLNIRPATTANCCKSIGFKWVMWIVPGKSSGYGAWLPGKRLYFDPQCRWPTHSTPTSHYRRVWIHFSFHLNSKPENIGFHMLLKKEMVWGWKAASQQPALQTIFIVSLFTIINFLNKRLGSGEHKLRIGKMVVKKEKLVRLLARAPVGRGALGSCACR